jgi:hypothetical protein
MTPSEFIEMLRTASDEEVAEIRRLLGVPSPNPPRPVHADIFTDWYRPRTLSGPTAPMAESRLTESRG